VVSEFVERPRGASAAAIVRANRPPSAGGVPMVGRPMHRRFATLIEALAQG
jgi:hypothetical protein